jgi:sec-independent protein translocase protein TatA
VPLALFQTVGIPELLIVLGVVLLILGPKRLPMLGRQLGSGMREFKDSVTRKVDKDDDEEPPSALAAGEPAAGRERAGAEAVSERR